MSHVSAVVDAYASAFVVVLNEAMLAGADMPAMVRALRDAAARAKAKGNRASAAVLLTAVNCAERCSAARAMAERRLN